MNSIVKGIIIGFAVIGVVSILLFLFDRTNSDSLSAIESFADCKRAGFEISGEDPKVCTTPDGRAFEEFEQGLPGIGL